MSVYDLYQSYINQMKSPVVPEASGVDPNYLLYLQQQQQMQGGGDGGSTFSPNLTVGQQPPSALMTGIMSMIAPPIGLAMGAQRLSDKGMLPGPLNSLFASRASGNVEMGLPQAINMQSVFNDFGFNSGRGIGGFTGTPSQMAALASEYGGGGGFSDGTSSAADGGEAGAAAASAAGANDGPDTGGSF